MTTYYVDELLPNGQRVSLSWAGQHTGGALWLAMIQRHAKRHHQKILVGLVQSKRDLACGIARRYVANHADWIYDETRPIPLALIKASGAKPGGPKIRTDCSGAAKAIAYAAGYPDPTGLGYAPFGNTESFTAHAEKARLVKPRSHALHGDFATFLGPIQHQHEIMLLEDVAIHADPLVFSFGSPGGPRMLPLSAEIDAHPGQSILFQDAGV